MREFVVCLTVKKWNGLLYTIENTVPWNEFVTTAFALRIRFTKVLGEAFQNVHKRIHLSGGYSHTPVRNLQ